MKVSRAKGWNQVLEIDLLVRLSVISASHVAPLRGELLHAIGGLS